MIENAAYASRTVMIGGQQIRLERGEICVSIRFLATAWRWEKTRVHRFLAKLKACDATAIRNATQSATTPAIITICNYSKYQTELGGDAAQNATYPDSRPQQTTKKERKEAAAQTEKRMEVGNRILEICDVDQARWTGNFSIVSAWMNAGYDPELDIYPTVERISLRPNLTFHTLNYFIEAIADAHRHRNRAIPEETNRADGGDGVAGAAMVTSEEAELSLERMAVLFDAGYTRDEIVAMKVPAMSAEEFETKVAARMVSEP